MLLRRQKGMATEELIWSLPKAELHVHIEGCIEPELALEIARRNDLLDKLPFDSVESAKAAFAFDDLQQFLNMRDATLAVLLEKRDFADVMLAFLAKCAEQNVVHVEIHFDPQIHMMRGIPAGVFVGGLTAGMQAGCLKHGLSAKLIACFLTELSPESALVALKEVLPWKQHIVAVGLARGIAAWDGTRYAHSAYEGVMATARRLGFGVTVHAGEEGAASEIWEALQVLKASRIDHGVHCLDDEDLVRYLEEMKTPLTVCPLSNFKLQVYGPRLLDKMRDLLRTRIRVTVNSDDPPFFGGYTAQNLAFWASNLQLSDAKVRQLIENSFKASFLPVSQKLRLLETLAVTLRLARL